MPQDQISQIVEKVGGAVEKKLAALKINSPEELRTTVLSLVEDALGAKPAELQAVIARAVMQQIPAGAAFNPGAAAKVYDPRVGMDSLSAEKMELLHKQLLFAVAPKSIREGRPEIFGGASAKDLQIQVGADGGFMVPTEFVGEVLRKLVKISTFRGLARTFNGVGMKGEIPRETGTVTISYVGEGATIPSTQPALGSLTWGLNKRTALVNLTKELFEFSAIDVITLLSTMIAEQNQLKDDSVFMNGTGSNQPTGLRTIKTGMSTVAQAGANLDWTDLVALKHALPVQYRLAGAVLIATNNAIQLMAELKDDNNRPIFLDRGPAGIAGPNVPAQTVGFVLGFPVVENNYIPENLGAGSNATEIWFSLLNRGYVVFDRGSMETKTSEESGDNFVENKMTMRSLTYDDGKVGIAEASAYLSGVK